MKSVSRPVRQEVAGRGRGEVDSALSSLTRGGVWEGVRGNGGVSESLRGEGGRRERVEGGREETRGLTHREASVVHFRCALIQAQSRVLLLLDRVRGQPSLLVACGKRESKLTES